MSMTPEQVALAEQLERRRFEYHVARFNLMRAARALREALSAKSNVVQLRGARVVRLKR